MGNLSHIRNSPHDPRHRFPLGNLLLSKNVITALTVLLGSEVEARFKLGEIVHRHLSGYHGRISLEDRTLNEFVIRERTLRGSEHVVLSRHALADIELDVVTHLGDRKTVVRLGERECRVPQPQPQPRKYLSGSSR